MSRNTQRQQEELRRRFEEQFLPQSLEDLEKLAASNPGKDWFVGETVNSFSWFNASIVQCYACGKGVRTRNAKLTFCQKSPTREQNFKNVKQNRSRWLDCSYQVLY